MVKDVMFSDCKNVSDYKFLELVADGMELMVEDEISEKKEVVWEDIIYHVSYIMY